MRIDRMADAVGVMEELGVAYSKLTPHEKVMFLVRYGILPTPTRGILLATMTARAQGVKFEPVARTAYAEATHAISFYWDRSLPTAAATNITVHPCFPPWRLPDLWGEELRVHSIAWSAFVELAASQAKTTVQEYWKLQRSSPARPQRTLMKDGVLVSTDRPWDMEEHA